MLFLCTLFTRHDLKKIHPSYRFDLDSCGRRRCSMRLQQEEAVRVRMLQEEGPNRPQDKSSQTSSS